MNADFSHIDLSGVKYTPFTPIHIPEQNTLSPTVERVLRISNWFASRKANAVMKEAKSHIRPYHTDSNLALLLNAKVKLENDYLMQFAFSKSCVVSRRAFSHILNKLIVKYGVEIEA